MQTIKRIIFLVPIFLFIFILCSCNKDIQNFQQNISISENQLFVYDPFIYKLGVYDLESMEWSEIGVQDTLCLGFDWGNIYPYYTMGNLGIYEYHAGKIIDNSLDFYFSLDDKNVALVPFATNGTVFYYVVEQMNIEPCKKRIVTISEQGDIETVINLDGVGVMDGIIAGKFLYYTSSCDDECGNTNVWKIDISKENDKKQPLLVKKEYNDYKLYEYNDEVLFIDTAKQILYNENIIIKLKQQSTLVWVDDKLNILVEKYVNSESNIEMCITDITTNRILGIYKNAINFDIEKTTIKVYGRGFIEYLNLTGDE